MAVYIDNAGIRFGRMRMCHMIADSHVELVRMAERIGVATRWIQKPGTVYEHFDVCLAKRQLAIDAGAVAVSQRELGLKLRARRIAAERVRSACDGKIAHASRSAAAAAVQGMKSRRNRSDRRPPELYRCPHCGKWHVGGRDRRPKKMEAA
ncbi:MAG: DUF4031 domain-containing protein [Planctomycetota bacterium]